MNTPQISVIIPVYNVEPYLRECLDSVVNQTLRDIEIICVNDGSTDNSGAILAEYAAQDKQIIVITQENRGLSAARNTGMDVAGGKYVYFIDSDDYIDLNALEVLYNRAEELEVDVLFFDYINFCDGIDGEPWQLARRVYTGIYRGVELQKIWRDDRVYSVPVWNELIRHDFLLKTQLRFYEGIIYEDQLFTALLFLKAERVSHIGYKGYHRRLRPHSITMEKVSSMNIYAQGVIMQEILTYGMHRADNSSEAFEIWRTIVECRNQVWGFLHELPAAEKSEIRFEKPFTQILYQKMLVEPMEAEVRLQTAKREAARLNSALEAANEKTSAAEQSATVAWREVDNIHRSATYRIGRVITWVPRMARGFARCYREHGWRYTWHRVVTHLRGR